MPCLDQIAQIGEQGRTPGRRMNAMIASTPEADRISDLR